ncbi:MAG: anti-sigma factor antagonist [Anaerolineae bacterium]|nr:anti-sigma factor antagonist [Anaerolineae bacterium]
MKQTATFPGRYAEIRNIGRFLVSGYDAAELEDDARFQVELATDEAATNIIEHAYGAENVGDIIVTWETTDDALTITLQDTGPRFAPDITALEQSPIADDENLKIGGLGLHFIRTLMDEVHFSYEPDVGNTLTLVKWRKSAETDPILLKHTSSGLYIVTVRGRLDHALNAQFENALDQLLVNSHFRIIVNMQHVTYINSSGLRILVSVWRRVRTHDGNLVLANLDDHVMEVFTIVGFDKLFDMFDSVAAAQAALEGIT